MGKLVLSKSGLQKQRENMRLYERVLPSLELKRMQLTAELKRARQALADVQSETERRLQRVSEQLPMLADGEIDLAGLVHVESIDIREENVVGVKLPSLVAVRCGVAGYAMLARPHWVDTVAEELKRMVAQKALVQVTAERVRLLEAAARKVTQRTNLFEKILIPQAQGNIRKIRIYLADADRASVVRSKITKRIRQKQAQALLGATP
jgi:V/A-type H+/Na+-transporting ATPase subunit D